MEVTRNTKHIVMGSGWFFPDSIGGTEAYVSALSNDLIERGWRVSVVSPSRDEKEYDYAFGKIHVYRYPICLNPCKKEVSGEQVPVFFERFQELIARIKPDLFHMHTRSRALSLWHAQFIKNELNIPLVLTIHAADFMCAGGTSLRWGQTPCDGRLDDYRCTACWIHSYKVPKILSNILAHSPSWISRHIAPKLDNKVGTALRMKEMLIKRNKRLYKLFDISDAIIAISHWINHVLEINGVSADKITLCRHGLARPLDIKAHAPVMRNDGILRIGYLGRYSKVKGLDVLIHAVKGLPAATPVKLFIHGVANDLQDREFLRMIRRLSYNDARIVLGEPLNDNNRFQTLRTFDVLAVPSVWFETGPLVVLEGFAAGLPILGSRLGGLVENVNDKVNGMLIEPGNVIKWREAIQWLALNRQVIPQWKQNIPPIRTSKDVAEEMETVYSKIFLQA